MTSAASAAHSDDQTLPPGWVRTTLGEVALINPGVDTSQLSETTLVSFVPMAAVEAGTGRLDATNVRPLSEVKRGFTAFREGDVLFAKITPCMENGKFAVARALASGIGFGSTEFHVLRPEQGLNPYFLLYYLLQDSFRQSARASMGGSAGQLRVPASFLAAAEFPFPPLAEQRRIVAAIERHLTRLDAVVETLRRDRVKLKNARAALLRDAVEGRLTERWRATHPVAEDGEALLRRILAERRARWEAGQLERMRARGQEPRDDRWKQSYREPAGPDTSTLPPLPSGWCWATVEQVSCLVRYGTSAKTSRQLIGVPVLRMGNIQDGRLDFSDLKYLPEDHYEFPDLLLEPGDLLFNRTNSAELVGKSAVYHGNFKKCSYASYLICVRTIEKYISEYLCYFLNSIYGRKWVASVVSQQVGQANVSGSKLEALFFPLPPLEEQRQIVAEVERRLTIIQQVEEAIERSLKRAERLRQSILKRAFSGQLVPQDPRDEPASRLLERIRAERARREPANAGRCPGQRRSGVGAGPPSLSLAEGGPGGLVDLTPQPPEPLDPQQIARPSLWEEAPEQE